jgi:hypothetical protein
MINDQLIRRLEKLAAKWEQASDQLAVDEPDAMDTVEDDTMSPINGETAGELRNIIRDARAGATGIEQLWEPVPAEENATLLLVPARSTTPRGCPTTTARGAWCSATRTRWRWSSSAPARRS